MSYAADVIIIILAFAAFGYTHSLLASKGLKKIAAEKLGGLASFYRLIYNIISVLSFYIFYILIPQPDLMIYDLSYPWDFLILIPQFLSLGGLIWSAKYLNLGEFTGITQIRKWIEGTYNPHETDGGFDFIETGPYRYSRHPIYLFSILFLAFRPAMNLFYLTLFICITAYFYIGSVYEEKKLLKDFGQKYSDYRERVPRIFPIKIR